MFDTDNLNDDQTADCNFETITKVDQTTDETGAPSEEGTTTCLQSTINLMKDI